MYLAKGIFFLGAALIAVALAEQSRDGGRRQDGSGSIRGIGTKIGKGGIDSGYQGSGGRDVGSIRGNVDDGRRGQQGSNRGLSGSQGYGSNSGSEHTRQTRGGGGQSGYGSGGQSGFGQGGSGGISPGRSGSFGGGGSGNSGSYSGSQGFGGQSGQGIGGNHGRSGSSSGGRGGSGGHY